MEEIRSNFIHDEIDADLAADPSLKIHTRFPPEPNGYLHIGSAKAIWINAATAKKYGGTFNLRYDDTNPSKEDTEYVDSIYEDLNWLGCAPSGGIFYGSDYFDKCYEYAVKLPKPSIARRISPASAPAICARAMAAMPLSMFIATGTPNSMSFMSSMGDTRSKVMRPLPMFMFSAWKSPSSLL